MKKQMSYANAKNIPFVAIVGENEMNEGKAMLKNMETGEQNLVSVEELIAKIKEIGWRISKCAIFLFYIKTASMECEDSVEAVLKY